MRSWVRSPSAPRGTALALVQSGSAPRGVCQAPQRHRLLGCSCCPTKSCGLDGQAGFEGYRAANRRSSSYQLIIALMAPQVRIRTAVGPHPTGHAPIRSHSSFGRVNGTHRVRVRGTRGGTYRGRTTASLAVSRSIPSSVIQAIGTCPATGSFRPHAARNSLRRSLSSRERRWPGHACAMHDNQGEAQANARR